MRCKQFLLALMLSALVILPASADNIFGKKTKPDADKLPQLITNVKTETDEGKRTSAAKELREFDPAVFPDLVPILIDVVQHDASAGVRAEAASTLGHLRPVNQEAGAALEAATHDGSIKVRWQARSALMGYRIAGYRSGPKKPEPAISNTDKGEAKGGFGSRLFGKRASTAPANSMISVKESSPPPLAGPSTNGPLPTGLAPILQKAPAKSTDQGPDLSPPK